MHQGVSWMLVPTDESCPTCCSLTLRLWSTIVAHTTYMLPSYTFDLGPWLGVLNDRLGARHHTITVEMVGDANANWDVAGILQLWRGDQAVVASGKVYVEAPTSFKSGELPSSNCKGHNLTDQDTGIGLCSFSMPGYQMAASGSVTLADGSKIASLVLYRLHRYSDVIAFNNPAMTSGYDQSSSHSVFWSSESIPKKQKQKKKQLHTYDVTYDWMNSGQDVTGGIWVNSFNFSGNDGTRRKWQEHYQRLEMVNGTFSSYLLPPVIPPNVTHTVFLRSFDSVDVPKPTVLQLATATWAAISLNSSETARCSTSDIWMCWPL